MKIQLYYFSGTGNTLWVVKKLSDQLRQMNHEVDMISVEDIKSSDLCFNHVDLIGVAFPIHSSYAPTIMQEFIQKLPKVKQNLIFTITTAGYMVGDVGWYETKKLENKGYIPFLFGNVIMGNNLHLPKFCPLPVTSSNKMSKRLLKVERKINKLANLISQTERYKKGADPIGRIYGLTQRFIARKFENYAFKGFTVDHENCITCGLCIKNCPTHNISLENKQVTISDECMICMRCYNFCPKQAIHCTEKTKSLKYKRYLGPEGKGFKSIKE